MLGNFHPIEIESIEVINILWTKENSNTAHSLVKLPSMLPGSSFQPEQNNSKQLILQQDAQITKET